MNRVGKIGLLISIVFVLFGVTIAMGSNPKVLAEIPWGSGSDKIGLLNQQELETVGPKSFTVDNGKVYILDFVNQELKVFDLNAKKLSKLADKIIGGSICVGPNGNLLVLNGKKVKALSNGGKSQDSIDIADDIDLIEGYGQDVQVENGKSIVVNGENGKGFKVAEFESGKLAKFNFERQVASGKPPHKKDANGQVSYDVKWIDRNTINLLKFNSKDELIKTFELKTNDTFGGVQIKGIDSKGNVYVEIERITPDNYVHLEIKKINPGGKEIGTVELINNYFTTVYKKTEVDVNGNIYQMITDENGVKILLWVIP